MIVEVKSELRDAAINAGINFVSKSISELEKYAQQYDFETVLVNLDPIKRYPQKVQPSGSIYYNFKLDIYFLTKFQKSNHLEETKDQFIDQTIIASEVFMRNLNKNTNRIFINPNWSWDSEIIRQYTSNLLCGCKISIGLDTSCNRVKGGITYAIESPIN